MTQIEHIKGRKWIYEYAPMNKYPKTDSKRKVWHLFTECMIGARYHGNFATKKAMYEYIEIHNTGGV